MFRGREATHPERGRDLLMRLAEDVKELGQIESQPLLDGRNMVMVLGPHRNVQADRPQVGAAERCLSRRRTAAAKKRFKVTGAGKLLRRHAMQSHNLEKKSRQAPAARSAATSRSPRRTHARSRRLLGH